MDAGAPDAIQVADRFHLFKNFAEALERTMETQAAAIKIAEAAWQFSGIAQLGTPTLAKAPPMVGEEVEESQYTAERRAQHEEVWQLYRLGWTSAAIARRLEIGVRTVQRDLRRPAYANGRGQANRGKCLLDAHKDHLVQCWQSGIRARGNCWRLSSKSSASSARRPCRAF